MDLYALTFLGALPLAPLVVWVALARLPQMFLAAAAYVGYLSLWVIYSAVLIVYITGWIALVVAGPLALVGLFGLRIAYGLFDEWRKRRRRRRGRVAGVVREWLGKLVVLPEPSNA